MPDVVTILIVDDSDSDRLLCRQYLQRDTQNIYRILEADTIAQAIEIWRSQQPDITLVDFNLRDGNGLVFLEAIRTHIYTSNIRNSGFLDSKLPMIMLTGHGDERIAVNAMKLGAFDYLVKHDITEFSLRQSIHSLLDYLALLSQLEQSRRREALIARLSSSIRQFLNLEDICQTITQEICKFLQADRTLIYKFNQDMSRRIVSETVVEPWQSCVNAVSEKDCINIHANAQIHEYKKGKVLVASDIYNANFADCHVRMLEGFHVRANIVVPILLSDSVNHQLHDLDDPHDPSLWGLLIAHQCSAPRVWKDGEIQLLQQISVQIAIAIQQTEIYEDLQNLNNSLEQQIQERTLALQTSENKLRSILSSLPDIINLFAKDGTYLEAIHNNTAYDLVPPHIDRIGRKITELLPEAIVTRQLQAIQQALATGEMQTLEQSFVINNRLSYEEVRVVPFQDDSAIVVVRDISDRRQMELALQNSLQRERMINHFVQTIRNSLDLEVVFEAATNAIANLLNLEQVTIVQYLSARKVWKQVAVFRQDGLEVFNKIGFEIPDEGNPFAEQIKRKEIVQVHDTNDIEDDINRELAKQAFGAWLLVPIIVNDQVWGSLSSRKTYNIKPWESQEVELAQAIANQLAIAIQQATLYQQLQLELAERIQTEIKLAQAKESAETANRAKSDFLANMSHEIRTPMNGVIGMAQLLATTTLNEDQKHFVQIILDSGEALLSIINDILDLSKIESGKLNLEAKEFNLIDTLNSACNLFSKQAFDKNINLRYQIQPNLPRMFIGDSLRLRQILMNLVGNAIKFTAQGGITITVSGKSRTPNTYELQFAIADTGIGISSEHIVNLFKPFMQADTSINRQFGGTGLGLAICKRLVELMDGTVWVESRGQVGGSPPPAWSIKINDTHDKGAIFHFAIILPVHNHQSIKASDSLASIDVDIIPDQLPIKILIVEDNVLNQKITQLMLKKLGYDSDIIENGKECLRVLANPNSAYEIIFMDVQMPVMDGITATKKIRETLSSTNKPWIIALTADALAEEQKACMDAGMNDFISKPVRIKEVSRAIAAYIQQKQR